MLKRTIKSIFKGTGVKVSYDKSFSWINFELESGVNCEFYLCDNTGSITARYVIDGKYQTIDLNIFEDQEEIKRVVTQILNP